jgi:tetratricopeptide (TPR) repeat protein
VAEFRRAIEVDPLMFGTQVVFSCRLGEAGQWRKAMEIIDHALTLQSGYFIPAHGYRINALFELGRVSEAVEEARALRQRPEKLGRWHFDGVAISVLRRAGFEQEAKEYGAQVLAQPDLPPQSYVRGFVLGGLGRFDEARPFLERSPTLMTMGPMYDSMWDEWRETPGFRQLIASWGITKEYKVARETQARIMKEQAAKK